MTLLGIFENPIPCPSVNLFVQKEISIIGSQGCALDFQYSIDLIAGGRIEIKKLITSELSTQSLQKGFDLLLVPGKNQVKIV